MTSPKHPLPILVIGADYECHGSVVKLLCHSSTLELVRVETRDAGAVMMIVSQLGQMIRMPCPYCGEIWNLRSTEFEINLAEHIARNHQ